MASPVTMSPESALVQQKLRKTYFLELCNEIGLRIDNRQWNTKETLHRYDIFAAAYLNVKELTLKMQHVFHEMNDPDKFNSMSIDEERIEVAFQSTKADVTTYLRARRLHRREKDNSSFSEEAKETVPKGESSNLKKLREAAAEQVEQAKTLLSESLKHQSVLELQGDSTEVGKKRWYALKVASEISERVNTVVHDLRTSFVEPASLGSNIGDSKTSSGKARTPTRTHARESSQLTQGKKASPSTHTPTQELLQSTESKKVSPTYTSVTHENVTASAGLQSLRRVYHDLPEHFDSAHHLRMSQLSINRNITESSIVEGELSNEDVENSSTNYSGDVSDSSLSIPSRNSPSDRNTAENKTEKLKIYPLQSTQLRDGYSKVVREETRDSVSTKMHRQLEASELKIQRLLEENEQLKAKDRGYNPPSFKTPVRINRNELGLQLTDSIDHSSPPRQAELPMTQERRYMGPRTCLNPVQEEEEVFESRFLPKTSIGVFDGDKTKFPDFWSRFCTVIDKARVSTAYKLLKLKEALQGEALSSVEALGHSPSAYEIMKARLVRKYGGVRRQLELRLEDLDQQKVIKENSPKDLEKFAELLDMLIIGLLDANQSIELGAGVLYISLLRKLNENLLIKYQRWLTASSREGNVHSLKDFIDEESQYTTHAAELSRGIRKPKKENIPTKIRSHVQTDEKVKKVNKPVEQKENKKEFKQKSVSSNSVSRPKWDANCRFCGDDHKTWQCLAFKRSGIEEKWAAIRKEHLCYKCLAGSHPSGECTRTHVCGIDGCTDLHNRLLHVKKESNEKKKENTDIKTSQKETKIEASNITLMAKAQGYLALRTIPVVLYNENKAIQINALLDDGSSRSFLNQDIADYLQLKGEVECQEINTLNGQATTLMGKKVQCNIRSIDGKVEQGMNLFTVQRVTGMMQAFDWTEKRKEWNHLADIDFPAIGKRKIIDLLIGIDHCNLISSEIPDVVGLPGEPVARLTPLGWTCVGHTPGENTQTHSSNFSFFTQPRRAYVTNFYTSEDQSEIDGNLESALVRFWEEEEMAYDTKFEHSKLNREVLKKTEDSLIIVEGRYQIDTPWKQGLPGCITNRKMAIRRLQSTENRLRKEGALGLEYSNVFKNYLNKGYIRKVTQEADIANTKCLIPHFPIIKWEKETTKVRVVFDASVKVNGISLNDLIHIGPKLQQDLIQVLTRFRRFAIALGSDISEMYLQILLNPDDRVFHRFLWRDLEEREPDLYEMMRVMFGIGASPFMAQLAAKKNAEKHMIELPLAAATVKDSTYMDDTLDSVKNTKQAIILYKELLALWKKINMIPKKWISNSRVVMEQIPQTERSKQIDLSDSDLPVTKTLGMIWKAEPDIFQFQVKPWKEDLVMTKRNFLSYISTIFDPLGMISALTITGRIWLQRIWRSGASWDEELLEIIKQGVMEWMLELQNSMKIEIPRALVLEDEVSVQNLHTFSDASMEAYAACVYLHTQYTSGQQTVRLVMAKARVSPLRCISIPRLELMAAVLGTKLAEKVIRILEIQKNNSYYWTDSADVLCWIKNISRCFKPFVANRIGELHERSDPVQWHHVPTRENPADLNSRGTTAGRLATETKWWNGPDFLMGEKEDWPNKTIITESSDHSEEKLKNDFCTFTLNEDNRIRKVNLDELGFSGSKIESLNTQVRKLAWILRFIQNVRNPTERIHGELNLSELQNIKTLLIKHDQQLMFHDEISALFRKENLKSTSKIRCVLPFLDDQGVLRAKTRLSENQTLPWEMRFPTILHKKGPITYLLIQEIHLQYFHQGTNYVLNRLSDKYWLAAAREIIRKVENACQYCRRRVAKPMIQLMAPLPPRRTEKTLRPFVNCSVDYAGPFIVKVSRGRTALKRYLCLFTCLAVRAVHLELCYDLTTDGFINALMRMISRRGIPETMLSDNGSNLVGAERELRELINSLNQEDITKDGLKKGISWFFNPPSAPHHNGVHEIMVKSAKKNISAILGKASLTDEGLLTAIVIAEELINSRPLTYQTSNDGDLKPLSPNDFLIGRAAENVIAHKADDSPFRITSQWRRIQDLMKQFWKRWSSEWLSSLRARSKWVQDQKSIEVGQVVIVSSDVSPRGMWPLGKIEKTYPGPDGVVRVVDVRVQDKTFRRPVSKLCLLDRC